jgi:hypothetical protein
MIAVGDFGSKVTLETAADAIGQIVILSSDQRRNNKL